MTEPPAFPQQQADALVLVAESALAQGMDPGAAAERYPVVVHVDAAVLVDADQSGSRSSTMASAFPRKRRSVLRAMRAACSCGTMPTAV